MAQMGSPHIFEMFAARSGASFIAAKYFSRNPFAGPATISFSFSSASSATKSAA